MKKKENIESKIAPLFIILIITIISFLGITTYKFYANKEYTNDTSTITKVDTIDIQNTVTTEITDTSYSYKGSSRKDSNGSLIWNDFKINFPGTWKVTKEERPDDNYGTLNVLITKDDGSSFEIIRGEDEYGRCVFKDEPDYSTHEGMGRSYDNYKEINKGSTKWRFTSYTYDSELVYVLCEYENDEFYSLNSIGIDAIQLKSQEAINEFLEILEKAEIN